MSSGWAGLVSAVWVSYGTCRGHGVGERPRQTCPGPPGMGCAEPAGSVVVKADRRSTLGRARAKSAIVW